MTVVFGDFEVDPARFELRRSGSRIPMEPQAFDVLAYLAAHRDRLVSKEELMDQIWGGRFVTESAVTSRIKQARRAAGDDGRTQRVIVTVHGRGYRFVGDAAAPSESLEPPQDLALLSGTAAGEEESADSDRVSAVALDRPSRPGGDPRQRELAVVERLLDRTRTGRGGVVVITGEPGIGKSRLLHTVISAVEELGGRACFGRAVESGGPFRPLAQAVMEVWRSTAVRESRALQPFRPALHRILPGWAPTTPAPTMPDVDPVMMIAEGILRILDADGAAFGVLVVDDVHDADRDTLAVLEYLTVAAVRQPALIVIARREWPRSAALDRIVMAAGVTRLALGRLPDQAVETMISNGRISTGRALTPATVASIVERAEGLPMVAVELAEAAAADGSTAGRLPVGFAALVEARMAALTGTERHLLAAAAVLGRVPDWDLVPAIADVPEATAAAGLRHAVQVHLLSVDGGELHWRHSLVRQTVWSRLLPTERRFLARTAAHLLLAQEPASDPGRAAELLSMVGDVDDAVEVWLRQARAALGTGGLRTAEQMLTRAADTGRAPARVAAERVTLLVHNGRPVDALQAGLVALPAARGDEHAELCLRLARAAAMAGRWREVRELLSRAGRPDETRALILLADAAHATGRLVEADEHAAVAVEQARTEGRADVLCEALCADGRIRRVGDPAAARTLFAEAAQIAGEHGLLPWRVEALFGMATIEVLLDEEPTALVEVRKTATAAGLIGSAAQADVLLADQLLIRDGPAGDAEPALRVGEFGRLARLPFMTFAGEILLATRSALAGDEQAMEYRLAALDAGPELPPDSRSQLTGVRGLAAVVRQDLTNAGKLLDAAMRPLATHRSAAPLVLFGVWALVATLIVDDATDVRMVLMEQTAGQRRANQGALRYADAAGAEAALIEGDTLLTPVPWWRRFLRTPVLADAVNRGWGDPVPRLRVDLAGFEDAGEQQLARWCRDLLRAVGAPTRRGPGDATVPIGLRALGVTSREVDVLQLIEAGLPNADIATRLVLSPRTIETHLTNLLAKSGATNRAQLVARSTALGGCSPGRP